MCIQNPCPNEAAECRETVSSTLLSHENSQMALAAAPVFAELSSEEEVIILPSPRSHHEVTQVSAIDLHNLERIFLLERENLQELHQKVIAAVEEDDKQEEINCYKTYCDEFDALSSHIENDDNRLLIFNHIKYLDDNAQTLGSVYIKEQVEKIDTIVSIVLSYRERNKNRDRTITEPWLDIKNMATDLYDLHVPVEKETAKKVTFSLDDSKIYKIPTRRALKLQEQCLKQVEEAYADEPEEEDIDSDEEDSLTSSRPLSVSSASINKTAKDIRMERYEEEAHAFAAYVESRLVTETYEEVENFKTQCKILYFRCLSCGISRAAKIERREDVITLQQDMMDLFMVFRVSCSMQLRKYDVQMEEIFQDFVYCDQTVRWFLRLNA